MNPETIIAELRGINAWRRGGEEIEQPDPKHIGEVLDAAADSLASLIASNTTLRHFPKLSIPRKAQSCRICGTRIEAGEPCCRWSTVERGEGYQTSHAHPECYQYTLDSEWDAGDWECALPGDVSRPNTQGQRRRASDAAEVADDSRRSL